MRKKAKIQGARGKWTANVEGKQLAVLHNTWWIRPSGYRDPMESAKRDGKKYQELIAALRNHDCAVMQRDAADGSFSRDGYIGVFSFRNLIINEDGSIELELVDRIADPKI